MCASMAAGVIESVAGAAVRSGAAVLLTQACSVSVASAATANSKALDIDGMVQPGTPELRPVEPGAADGQRFAVGSHDAFDQAATRLRARGVDDDLDGLACPQRLGRPVSLLGPGQGRAF